MRAWLKNPRLFWNSFQYISGLRISRLVRLTRRPDATYRAISFGVPEEHWDAFEAAYPEYEMIFARPDIMASELRLALAPKNTVLLAFDGAPQRTIQVATRMFDVLVFHASFAPVPMLERGEDTARGFMIDTMGDWLKARRQTEVSIFLDNFDLSGRDRLLAASRHLLEATAPMPTGEGCLILQSVSTSARADDDSALRTLAADIAPPEAWVIFDEATQNSWSAPDVVLDYLSKLAGCNTVVAVDNPLALLAVLYGRRVVVSGRPFWAGFGLTSDANIIKRRRDLSQQEMVAILIFILSRYVDEGNRLIDPADDWTLPGFVRLPHDATTARSDQAGSERPDDAGTVGREH